MGDTSFVSCEIVTIGSELLIGQLVDTNSSMIAGRLTDSGILVKKSSSVGDISEEIEEAVLDAVGRCDFVLTTGGLGPTGDDLTRQAVAAAAGVELHLREDLLEQIAAFFKRFGYTMSENNKRQAFIPEGSEALFNPVGTAPGFICHVKGIPVISIPGVPREAEYLMDNTVIPWIRKRFSICSQKISHRILKITGIGESLVDDAIGDLIIPGGNPEVALLASPGDISLRITARTSDQKEAIEKILPVEREIRSRLGKKIYGKDRDTMEQVVEALLEKRGLSLSILDACTQGFIAGLLYSIPSRALKGSMVFRECSELMDFCRRNGSDSGSDWIRNCSDMEAAYLGSDLVMTLTAEQGSDPENDIVRVSCSVTGRGTERSFEWDSGGGRKRVNRLSALTGLNTLRLFLLEELADR